MMWVSIAVTGILFSFGAGLCAAASPDHFTEVFHGDFDLDHTTFTFKPDRSTNGYAVCRAPATVFPTATNNGFMLFDASAGGASIPLNVGLGLPFYGRLYSSVQVSANGSVTYGPYYSNADAGLDSSLTNHFRLPRVSPWLSSLWTDFARPVHVNELSNRIALTWMRGESNNVQLELFFDGVIRLTYLNMSASNGIVGLSRGGGIPPGFVESDFSTQGCAGQALYELVWNAPSTAQVNQPFPVSLQGRDAFNLNFPVLGSAQLSAGQTGMVVFHADFEQGMAGFVFSNASTSYTNFWHRSTYRGLQVGHSPIHSLYFGTADSASPSERTLPPAGLGLAVSPVIDLQAVYPPIALSLSQLVNFSSFFASTVIEILDIDNPNAPVLSYPGGGGVSPADTSNRWMRTSLDISSFAGRRIRVQFRAGSGGGIAHQNHGWQIDDITIVGTTGSIPVIPSETDPFTGNSWTGDIRVAVPASRVVLIAALSNGVYGLSAPVEVGLSNDLVLQAITPQPHLLIGRTGSVDILISNTGPETAQSVVVTNFLPSGLALGNVAVSQGSFSTSGASLFLNFGSLGSGAYALASFEFKGTVVGTHSIMSTATRAGTEANAQNNHAMSTIHVGQPTVSLASVQTNEGAGHAVMTLWLDSPSPLPITVGFATLPGTAVSGGDFFGTNGLVTIPANATNVELRIPLVNDNIFEGRTNYPADPPEHFFVELIAATNATLGEAVATVSIQENDPVPVITVLATNIMELNADTNNFPVTIRISRPAAMPVDLRIRTETGLRFHMERGGYTVFGTAIDGTDFLGQDLNLVLAPGETQRVVHLPIVGDTETEPDETLTLILSSNVLLPISLGRPRPPFLIFNELTIIDDDPPVLNVDDYQIVAETCTNGVLDPGETVTVLLRVRNVGYNACTSSNLVATLLPTGGVQNPSGPQNYGMMCSGPEQWRPFTFTVAADCGRFLVATLSFNDDGTNRGTSSVPIPIGQRPRILHEDFESTTLPALPAGWTTLSENAFWTTATETNQTNRIARTGFFNTVENAAVLRTPEFHVSSSNAWVKFRHRFEVSTVAAYASVNLASNRFLLNGYNQASGWDGSSRGWMTTLAQLAPEAAGSTQSLQFTLLMLNGSPMPTWEIDSVEVFDGPSTCCEGGAPFLGAVRRDGTNLILQWSAISNRTYQLEFKPSLRPAENWRDAGMPVTATGSSIMQTSAITSSNGFYRVRLNP